MINLQNRRTLNKLINTSRLIMESKKASGPINVIFLSALSEKKADKSSNSFNIFKERADERFNLVNIDPTSAVIEKTANKYDFLIDGEKYSVKNTIVVPRRSVLQSTTSRDFFELLKFYGFFILNDLAAFDICENKFETFRLLKERGLSTPRTVLVSPNKIGKIDDLMQQVGGQYPVVCKILNGTQGVGVFQCDSRGSLVSVLQTVFKLSHSDIIIQEKIESDFDLRIHVFCDTYDRYPSLNDYKIIGVMQRNKIESDFRTNFSLGATVEKGNLTPEIEQLAIAAAAAANCRWCGVDIIIAKDGTPYVLEINTSPGTKGVTSIGFDPVGNILEFASKFYYTDYDAKTIGCVESCKVSTSDDNWQAVRVGFDITSTYNTIFAKSIMIDENKNTVTYMLGDSTTVTAPIQGHYLDNSPLIELDIKFNGKTYKNVMARIIEIEKDNNIISETEVDMMMSGKFIVRLGSGISVSPEHFVVTDDIK